MGTQDAHSGPPLSRLGHCGLQSRPKSAPWLRVRQEDAPSGARAHGGYDSSGLPPARPGAPPGPSHRALWGPGGPGPGRGSDRAQTERRGAAAFARTTSTSRGF